MYRRSKPILFFYCCWKINEHSLFSLRIRPRQHVSVLFENGYFFSPAWPTVQTYPIKTITENASFQKRSPEWRFLIIGRGTPLYGLYRYVRRQRVWFFSRYGRPRKFEDMPTIDKVFRQSLKRPLKIYSLVVAQPIRTQQ